MGHWSACFLVWVVNVRTRWKACGVNLPPVSDFFRLTDKNTHWCGLRWDGRRNVSFIDVREVFIFFPFFLFLFFFVWFFLRGNPNKKNKKGLGKRVLDFLRLVLGAFFFFCLYLFCSPKKIALRSQERVFFVILFLYQMGDRRSFTLLSYGKKRRRELFLLRDHKNTLRRRYRDSSKRRFFFKLKRP